MPDSHRIPCEPAHRTASPPINNSRRHALNIQFPIHGPSYVSPTNQVPLLTTSPHTSSFWCTTHAYNLLQDGEKDDAGTADAAPAAPPKRRGRLNRSEGSKVIAPAVKVAKRRSRLKRETSNVPKPACGDDDDGDGGEETAGKHEETAAASITRLEEEFKKTPSLSLIRGIQFRYMNLIEKAGEEGGLEMDVATERWLLRQSQ